MLVERTGCWPLEAWDNIKLGGSSFVNTYMTDPWTMFWVYVILFVCLFLYAMKLRFGWSWRIRRPKWWGIPSWVFFWSKTKKRRHRLRTLHSDIK